MTTTHDVRISGAEGVALSVVRELIDRGFEAPRNTSEFLELYCRCLLTISRPEEFSSNEPPHDALRQGTERVSEPVLPQPGGDF
jgi:hypothetical protein